MINTISIPIFSGKVNVPDKTKTAGPNVLITCSAEFGVSNTLLDIVYTMYTARAVAQSFKCVSCLRSDNAQDGLKLHLQLIQPSLKRNISGF